MKYIVVDWPEIQSYMDRPDYKEECLFDPNKNLWAIPETWEEELGEQEVNYWDFDGPSIGDLEDAMG